jgi:metallo-beta-lactamase family protein
MVIISASGMCEAGRILHHLRNNIENPRNTVLIAGFQAEHTLGRRIVEKHEEVPIFGEPHRLRAEVAVINELSGHADQQDLVEWVRPIAKLLRGVFLVHGEPSQSEALKGLLTETFGLEVHIPARGGRAELSI